MNKVKTLPCRIHPREMVEFWACDCTYEKEIASLRQKLKIAEEALEKVENTMSEVNGHCGCEYNRFGDPCEHEIARDALSKIREVKP